MVAAPLGSRTVVHLLLWAAVVASGSVALVTTPGGDSDGSTVGVDLDPELAGENETTDTSNGSLEVNTNGPLDDEGPTDDPGLSGVSEPTGEVEADSPLPAEHQLVYGPATTGRDDGSTAEPPVPAVIGDGGPDATDRVAPADRPAHTEEMVAGHGYGQAQEDPGAATPALPTARVASSPITFLAVGLVGYGLTKLRHLGWVWLAPLYSRLSKEELLENDRRQELLGFVKRRPGSCVKRISDRCGTAWGATVYHLNRLEDAGFVFSRRQGRHRRYYAAGEEADVDLQAVGLLREDTPGKIASHLLEAPGTNQTAVAEALGIAPPTVHKHVARLEGSHLVERVQEGREIRYHPTGRLARLIERLDEAPEAVA